MPFTAIDGAASGRKSQIINVKQLGGRHHGAAILHLMGVPFGNLMFWAALTTSGVVDFATTVAVCIIVIGIDRACRCALAEADYLPGLFR